MTDIAIAMDEPPRLFVGVPCFGKQLYQDSAQSLLELQALFHSKGWQITTHFVGNESLIPRARNNIVDAFLKSGGTHLLFVDADIGFAPSAVLGMLSSGKPVVCGAYPLKRINENDVYKRAREGCYEPVRASADLAINLLGGEDGSDINQGVTENGCAKALYAATGFLLIERDVLLRMMAHYPELQYASDAPTSMHEPRWALFDCMLHKGRYLSEDYAFSERWRAMGGDIWVYLQAELTHTGTHTFLADLTKHFMPVSDAAAGFTWPKDVSLDRYAMNDLLGVLNGSYDVPVEGVETVLDIGANIGAFARWAAFRWPCQIDSYEPHPKAFELLLSNTRGLLVALRQQAVRAHAGKALLHNGLGGTGYGCSSFHDLGQQAMSGHEVECINAASLPSYDVVKLDIEGDELDVLRALDLSKTKAVMYEWHRPDDELQLRALMHDRGFKCIEVKGTVAKWIRA